MRCLLYLKRSLLRRPKRHLSLFVILVCAFVLPLLISIYRDSSEYGERLRILSETRGETFHILNAREEDLSLFEGLRGLSEPFYEDGIIYLHILSEDEWRDFWALDGYSSQISDIIRSAAENRLMLRCFEYDYANAIPDASQNLQQVSLVVLNMFIIFISSLTVGSAYKSHIRRFSADMAVLRSLGAEEKQIYAIFLCEFAIVFAMSAAAAVAISAGVMKLLFSAYLEVNGVDGLAWVIFKINPLSTMLHIAFFFAVLLVVIMRTLVKASKESTVSAMRGDIQSYELKKKLPKMKIKAKPEKTLASLWLKRTNRVHASCLWVTIPLMTVFLFLFGYLSLDAEFVSQPPEYELWITKDATFGGFSQKDIDYVSSLPEVEAADCRQDAPTELFNKEAGGLMIDQMRIKLTSPELHKEVESLLKSRFAGMEYTIDNFQAVAEQGAEMSKGIYLMLAFIFSAIFVFNAVIVYMKLRDYIDDCKKTLRTLSTLGAAERIVTSSYLRQSAASAAAATLVPTVLSIALLLLATIPAAIKPSPDLSLLAVYSCVGALTVCTFMLPVRRALKENFGKRAEK